MPTVSEWQKKTLRLSHQEAFTFLRRTGLYIKFCSNPCTDLKCCAWIPALQSTSKAKEHDSQQLLSSHAVCCFQVCLSLYLDLTWFCRLPKQCTRRENLFQTCLLQWAVPSTPTSALQCIELESAAAGMNRIKLWWVLGQLQDCRQSCPLQKYNPPLRPG